MLFSATCTHTQAASEQAASQALRGELEASAKKVAELRRTAGAMEAGFMASLGDARKDRDRALKDLERRSLQMGRRADQKDQRTEALKEQVIDQDF